MVDLHHKNKPYLTWQPWPSVLLPNQCHALRHQTPIEVHRAKSLGRLSRDGLMPASLYLSCLPSWQSSPIEVVLSDGLAAKRSLPALVWKGLTWRCAQTQHHQAVEWFLWRIWQCIALCRHKSVVRSGGVATNGVRAQYTTVIAPPSPSSTRQSSVSVSVMFHTLGVAARSNAWWFSSEWV